MFKNVFKLCGRKDSIKTTGRVNKYRNVNTAKVLHSAGRPNRRVKRESENGGKTELILVPSSFMFLGAKAISLPEPCSSRDALDKEMNDVLSRTKKLIEAGNLGGAESILENALGRSKRANSVWSNILLLLLGKIALKQGEHGKSERFYMELVQNLSGFLESSPAVERLRLWASIDLAQLYTETNDYKKAEEHYQFSLFTLEAMSVGEKDFHWAVETLHHVLDGYSELLTVVGRFDDALTQRQKAHQLCQTLYGEKHLKLVRSLNELGRIYAYQGRDDEAIRSFGKAIEMSRQLEGVEPMELAALLVNSGRIHLRKGLMLKAKEHCEQALAISGKARNKLGQTHANDCLEGVKKAMG